MRAQIATSFSIQAFLNALQKRQSRCTSERDARLRIGVVHLLCMYADIDVACHGGFRQEESDGSVECLLCEYDVDDAIPCGNAAIAGCAAWRGAARTRRLSGDREFGGFTRNKRVRDNSWLWQLGTVAVSYRCSANDTQTLGDTF